MNTNGGDTKVGLGARIAQWLRAHYPIKAKHAVAAEFGVSPGMAKLWLRGRAPATWHLEEMASRWGQRFVMHAFQDAFHAAEEWNLRRRAAALSNQLKAQTDELASDKASGRRGVAALGRAVASAGRATVRGLIGKLALRHRREAA